MVRSSTQPSVGPESSAAASSAAGAVRVSVLVVTADDGLWTKLTTGVPGLDAHQFDSVAELIDNWNASRPAVVVNYTPKEIRAFVVAESERFRKIAQVAGIKPR